MFSFDRQWTAGMVLGSVALTACAPSAAEVGVEPGEVSASRLDQPLPGIIEFVGGKVLGMLADDILTDIMRKLGLVSSLTLEDAFAEIDVLRDQVASVQTQLIDYIRASNAVQAEQLARTLSTVNADIRSGRTSLHVFEHYGRNAFNAEDAIASFQEAALALETEPFWRVTGADGVLRWDPRIASVPFAEAVSGWSVALGSYAPERKQDPLVYVNDMERFASRLESVILGVGSEIICSQRRQYIPTECEPRMPCLPEQRGHTRIYLECKSLLGGETATWTRADAPDAAARLAAAASDYRSRVEEALAIPQMRLLMSGWRQTLPLHSVGACSAAEVKRVVDSYMRVFGRAPNHYDSNAEIQAWCNGTPPSYDDLVRSHEWWISTQDPSGAAARALIDRSYRVVFGHPAGAAAIAAWLPAVRDGTSFTELAGSHGWWAGTQGIPCTTTVWETTGGSTVPFCR